MIQCNSGLVIFPPKNQNVNNHYNGFIVDEITKAIFINNEYNGITFLIFIKIDKKKKETSIAVSICK